MSESKLKTLSDQAEAAHKAVQAKHEHINPVIEVRTGMRNAGIPADVLTIDCLQTRNRIMLLLHDNEPDTLLYQFTSVDADLSLAFEDMPMKELSTDTLVHWMESHFQ